MGNSESVINTHYKALTTRAKAEQWFSIMPNAAENVVPIGRAA